MKAGGFPYVIPMLLLSVAFFATPLAVLVGFSFAGPDGATLANYVRFFGTRSIFASSSIPPGWGWRQFSPRRCSACRSRFSTGTAARRHGR
jgi:ABC-type sugar transport system permease subunit